MLYPAELRARGACYSTQSARLHHERPSL